MGIYGQLAFPFRQKWLRGYRAAQGVLLNSVILHV